MKRLTQIISCVLPGAAVGLLAGWADYMMSLGIRSFETLVPTMVLYAVGCGLLAPVTLLIRPFIPLPGRRDPTHRLPFVAAATLWITSCGMFLTQVIVHNGGTLISAPSLLILLGVILAHALLFPMGLYCLCRVTRHVEKILPRLLTVLGFMITGCLIITALLFDPTLLSSSPNPNPDILLVVIDGLPADALRVYNPAVKVVTRDGSEPNPEWSPSPYFDYVANDFGVLFSNHIAPDRSRFNDPTGLTAILRPWPTSEEPLETQPKPSLPRRLQTIGYDTALFSASPDLTHKSSITNEGFNFVYALGNRNTNKTDHSFLLVQEAIHYLLYKLNSTTLWNSALALDRMLTPTQRIQRDEPERHGPSWLSPPDAPMDRIEWFDSVAKEAVQWLDQNRVQKYFTTVLLTHTSMYETNNRLKIILDKLWKQGRFHSTLIILTSTRTDDKAAVFILKLPRDQYVPNVKVVHSPTISEDLFATLLEATLQPVPEYADSISVLPNPPRTVRKEHIEVTMPINDSSL